MDNTRITRQSVNRDGNRYCGPLVLAALLGCTTAEAAAKVREAKIAQAREWMRQRNIRQLGTEHLKDKKPNA